MNEKKELRAIKILTFDTKKVFLTRKSGVKWYATIFCLFFMAMITTLIAMGLMVVFYGVDVVKKWIGRHCRVQRVDDR